MSQLKSKTDRRGDTIVEVLIAIAVAGLAIGISYATANRSLQEAITTQEHNIALNYIENQVNDLRLRFQRSPSTFASTFAGNGSNYCLDDNPTNWNPYTNGAVYNSPTINDSLYKPSCKPSQQGTNYYINIHVLPRPNSYPNSNSFRVSVQWQPLSGGQTNQASVYYKLNGPQG